ncbi:MAG: HEPN domain-containing protein [Anaerolineales bacterium]
MREITEEWVFKAEEDYHSVARLLYSEDVPIASPACLHCQQCAEKYVKAFLEEHKVDFPRHHNLVQLLDMCLALDRDFETLRNNLLHLEGYAVAIRYPGVRISVEIAERALADAGHIREFVRTKLGIK